MELEKAPCEARFSATAPSQYAGVCASCKRICG